MNIAIYGRPVNLNQIELAETLVKLLIQSGHRVVFQSDYYVFLKQHLPLEPKMPVFTIHEEISSYIDFFFSIGGDGTLLDTVSLVKDSKPCLSTALTLYCKILT